MTEEARSLLAKDLAAAGYRPSVETRSIGRAAISSLRDGGELWRLPASDEGLGARLLTLGKSNLGGFVDGGRDEAGVWLVREVGALTLADRLTREPPPWSGRKVLSLAAPIARGLAACEAASLSPGAVVPETIVLAENDRAFIPADDLVRAFVGDPSPRREPSVPLRWAPRERDNGGRWNAAANRWALGVALYEMLSGSAPFGDGDEEPAPFPDAIAAELPSGLQGLLLKLLDPDPARRPARAEAIAAELERIESGRAAPAAERKRRSQVGARASAVSVVDAPALDGAAPSQNAPARRGRLLRTAWPIALGVAVAAAAVSLLAPAPPKPKTVLVPPVSPLTASHTKAADCAECHTRQAAEWRRSVMAHSVKSPLYNALESLIEEQVGRDADCPNGAGILRRANPATSCKDRATGRPITGSGGEHWCVNCHSPGENLAATMPAWDGRPGGAPETRRPVRDILDERSLEGISCAFCHQVHGPVGSRATRGYQGNATWTSFTTGAVFASRPEDGSGIFGIGNSGYDLRPDELLSGQRAGSTPVQALRGSGRVGSGAAIDPVVHERPSAGASAYLRSSEFCGACHDVRLFGSDTLAAPRGEHFKRLRNAYSEWAAWKATETRAGREAASCQGCHMSQYPGVCEPAPEVTQPASARGKDDPECPPGFRFVSKPPGSFAQGRVADNSPQLSDISGHWFSGVDVPLSREFVETLIDEPTVDLSGVPLSARRRRDLLLRHTFRFALGTARRAGRGLEIPLEVENVGAGHRVPAGFSQEREFWIHLTVRDGDDRVLYEVGRVDRGDEDLRDKVFERVNVNPDVLDASGRPEGLFGADVRDGPDLPQWSPPPHLGGASFRGKGLVNFQNGFLRCVRCIGTVDARGECQALPGQERRRADRFADGAYDTDTGECRSNLSGFAALFETYFPVGALDASRGQVKGPDAIIDTRSVPPGVPIRYTYDLGTEGRRGPFRVEARLLFRAFPPFLIRGFAAYEREMARRGKRPSGALVTEDMLRRLEVVELSRVSTEVR